MSRYVFKLPDLGEGTVEAELTQWSIKTGDWVEEDQAIAEVMTEKAAVEISAPVSGRVLALSGAPGDMIAVGSELIVFDTDASTRDSTADNEDSPATRVRGDTGEPPVTSKGAPAAGTGAARRSAAPVRTDATNDSRQPGTGRVMTSPAIRHRAREQGVDLRQVTGSGRGGRITRADFEDYLARSDGAETRAPAQAAAPAGKGTPERGPATEETKILGMRRIIAQRMAEAKRTIPHFSYVEEVDVTALESLRVAMNERRGNAPSLSYLPFLVLALVHALREFPQCNVVHDAQRELLIRHRAVHVGIATQTPRGLTVPVVRDADRLGLWALAAEITRVTTTARDGSATKQMLSGSTITVTSLGKLGGIASTPVINAPEVAILGVNKAVDRPMVVDGHIVVRRMMNLSSSFDHRFVDGYDAAAMIQAVRALLEQPAMIFAPPPVA